MRYGQVDVAVIALQNLSTGESMKKNLLVAVFATLSSGSVATYAVAADVAVALDINTAYVWRGLTFNDGFVLQPSLDVAKNGFGLNVWSNFDLDDYDGAVDSGEFSEVDLTGSYTHTFGPVDVSVGIIEYLFPSGADSTTEVFAGLDAGVGAGFSVSCTLYYDFDQVDDFFIDAGISYSYSINEPTTLSLTGSVGYAGEDFAAFYAGGADGGFFNYALTASVNYAVTDAFGVGVNINYSDSLDDDVLPDDTVDTTLFGGINITYAF